MLLSIIGNQTLRSVSCKLGCGKQMKYSRSHEAARHSCNFDSGNEARSQETTSVVVVVCVSGRAVQREANRCLGVTYNRIQPSRNRRQRLVTLALPTLFRVFMRGREAIGHQL